MSASDVRHPPPDIPGLRFVTQLGTGGYSEVYLYEQQRPRMNVAVKVLTRPDLTDQVRRQFTAEGDAMAALADHPSIVQVFNADIAPDGRPYLVMKYYPNPNLGVRARSERLSIAEALRIGIEISSAVETAHRAGILHRDIKPANILISQFGAAGLTDFGIAASKLDATGADGLSVPWSPPEVLFSHTAPDVQADVYSLAATIWHLLVGRSPFEVPGGDNQSAALMRRILEQPPPRTGRADIPDSLDRLLQQAMAKQPLSRPPSALAFARGLQAVEQEQRLALTQIIVPPSEHQVTREIGGPDSDATRIKAPTRLQAQLPAPALRQEQQASPPHDIGGFGVQPQPKPPRSLTRVQLAAIIAVVVAVAAVVGVVITGGRKSNGDKSGTTVTHNSGAPAVDAPGQPQVTVTASGSNYVYTWTWANAQPTDHTRWETGKAPETAGHNGDIASRSLGHGKLTVSAKVATLCLIFTVVNNQGTASQPSDAKCPG